MTLSKSKPFYMVFLIFLSTCTAEHSKTELAPSLSKSENPPHEIKPVYHAELLKEFNHDPAQAGFGQFLSVEMNRKGEFFVVDNLREEIHRMDILGNEHPSFQRAGQGPGEFLVMDLKFEDRLDQTGIYDTVQGRVTIMDAGLDLLHSTHAIERQPGIDTRFLGFNETGFFFKGSLGFTIFNYDEPRELLVFFQEFENEHAELILTLPSTERHATVIQRFISTDYRPYGRQVTLTKYGNKLIYISNDVFGYTAYDTSGEQVYTDSLSQTLTPYSFTEEHFKYQIAPFDSLTTLSEVRANEIISNLRATMGPNPQGFFNNSLVDVQGRLWFELYTELFENESRWIVWNRDTGDVFQVLFEGNNVRVQNAIDDTVVALKRNEYDLETLRIYNFSRE